MPRLALRHMHPDVTIFSIHVCLLQTYTIVLLEQFKANPEDTEKLQYPTETFLLHKERPYTDIQASEDRLQSPVHRQRPFADKFSK
jgi:hypothetical protein